MELKASGNRDNMYLQKREYCTKRRRKRSYLNMRSLQLYFISKLPTIFWSNHQDAVALLENSKIYRRTEFFDTKYHVA